MKKIKLLFFVFVLVAFISCKDESGEFARPVLSDSDMVLGIRDCLNISLDTANAHLAVPNGFYQYKGSAYRIRIPAHVEMIIDTLIEYGEKELIDSLIIRMNRMAEANGTIYKTQIGSLITKTSFPDPRRIITGNNSAASEYFKSVQFLPLIDILKPILAESMENFGVNSCWHEIITFYGIYDSTPLMLDLSYEITRQIAENIITEMAAEERLIRLHESHRKTNLLKKIFAHN